MILVCSGPDTYRAREKARGLVAAFRSKHDAHGLATETIDGSEGLAPLLSRLGSTSLFASKKLVRADGCLTKMKIADVRTLATRLAADHDATVVLTVEEDAPNSKTLDALKDAPLFHYPFVEQTGSVFRTWVRAQAERMNINAKIADAVAEMTDGDSWQAIQELSKQAAHAHEITASGNSVATSIFDVADAVALRRKNWRLELSSFDDDNAVSMAYSQARSMLRVRDGFTNGLHPYVVKKLGMVRTKEPEARALELLRALIGSRSSLATGNEVETII